MFATYPADLAAHVVPAAPGPTGYSFSGFRLSGFQPVVKESLQLGTLYVESDLGEMAERLWRYAAIAFAAAGLSLLAAYALSRRLQQRMSQPIMALADTAHAVSDQQTIRWRAAATGTREFDMLAGAFNHMLTQIQESEGAMRSQLGRLGLLQHITRAVGERQDIQSIFQVVLDSLDANFRADFDCALSYDSAARTLTVVAAGAASRKHLPLLDLAEGKTVAIDANDLSRCIIGQLVYEPEVAQVSLPFPQQFAAAGTAFSGHRAAARGERGLRRTALRASQSACLQQCRVRIPAPAQRTRSAREPVKRACTEPCSAHMTTCASRNSRCCRQERLRALGQMASGIAHDINNAISPVSLYTSPCWSANRT